MEKKGGEQKKGVTSSISSSAKKEIPVVSSDQLHPQQEVVTPTPLDKGVTMIMAYDYVCRDIPLHVSIFRKSGEYVKLYEVSVPSIGEHTKLILQKVREQLVRTVTLGAASAQDTSAMGDAFKVTVDSLIKRYFPTSTAQESQFFSSYVLLNSVGLGELELLLADESLEEVAINGAGQSIWVFHRRQGWCKTNIVPTSEDQIKYYASTIGRKAGRQISVLEPLLDVTLNVGDRVNATLMPISNEGNTITIRKFSAKPWTITEFLDSNVVSFRAAAILWHAIQYELSILIAGGTASGKTSILNILSNFFPPDQRIISIEDTREIKLPKILHVVPMLTRLANSEGRGGVSMLNLLQNSLRMRPDRILVGEIRKPAEAEVLFEAIHTGHSVYATIHANTAEETVTRLTNAPMNVPATMIPALSLVVVQYRNRRTGVRKTFEIAEITPSGTARVLFRYNVTKDILAPVEKPKHLYETFSTFTGATIHEIEAEIDLKEQILHWMCDQKLDTVESIGLIMAEFYANREQLLARLKLRTKKHKK